MDCNSSEVPMIYEDLTYNQFVMYMKGQSYANRSDINTLSSKSDSILKSLTLTIAINTNKIIIEENGTRNFLANQLEDLTKKHVATDKTLRTEFDIQKHKISLVGDRVEHNLLSFMNETNIRRQEQFNDVAIAQLYLLIIIAVILCLLFITFVVLIVFFVKSNNWKDEKINSSKKVEQILTDHVRWMESRPQYIFTSDATGRVAKAVDEIEYKTIINRE